MKLTESHLRKIIKEELQNILNEGDVESMKDYSSKEKYHANVLKRLYGDNEELKQLAQSGKQKAFAIKLGELVKEDDPEAKVKFFANIQFGGPNQFRMSPQAKELYFRMKGGAEDTSSSENPNVLDFSSRMKR